MQSEKEMVQFYRTIPLIREFRPIRYACLLITEVTVVMYSCGAIVKMSLDTRLVVRPREIRKIIHRARLVPRSATMTRRERRHPTISSCVNQTSTASAAGKKGRKKNRAFVLSPRIGDTPLSFPGRPCEPTSDDGEKSSSSSPPAP